MTSERNEPPSDSHTLTIVIRLPQDVVAISTLLNTINNIWPNAAFKRGLNYLEIPADGT